MNAVSPSTVKSIAKRFDAPSIPVKFIDGCILGAPPRPTSSQDAGTNVSTSSDDFFGWTRPCLPISGPHNLSSLPYGGHLTSVLNLNIISPNIGAANGLKMYFVALSKDFTAIATVLHDSPHHWNRRRPARKGLPSHLALVKKGVPGMPPKAYRWVKEMQEIAHTMNEEGG